uniref:Uncharacterized protein n=1 Tax=Parascaris univalens TaxID=6257 RepID=A0A915C6A1_PARUN
MYSTAHEGQKRGLLRPYGATHVGPVFRNLPLFGFLTALVVFFYVFYIYQAQNAELALMREEYSVLQQHLSKLKTENLDIKASLESCKDDEKSLQGEKSDANKKLEECASNLRSEKIRAESLKSDVAKVEVEIAECSRRVESAQSELLRLNGTMAAIHAVGMGNEALVITLNNTVNQLRGELARLKAEGHAESAVHVANELIQEAAPKAKMNSPTVSLIRAPGKSDHDEEMVKGNAQALAADEKNAAHLLYQDRGNDAKVFVVSSTAQSNADAQPHPLDIAKVRDTLDMDRPAGPGDRVKLEDRRNQQDEDDGRLVIPGGEYANSLVPEQGAFVRRANEAAPDFENDEKVNEREA